MNSPKLEVETSLPLEDCPNNKVVFFIGSDVDDEDVTLENLAGKVELEPPTDEDLTVSRAKSPCKVVFQKGSQGFKGFKGFKIFKKLLKRK